MKVSFHVSISALMAAALYAHSHSLPEAASCLASGVLIDLDHVIDFQLFGTGEYPPVGRYGVWPEREK